ncbi:hypothetical protein [Thalassobaculum salexigens]|uniref:hypothetical protein n=1 Tax=Thalassobaculum salexigens TaxID=455360 RepID=UPI00049031EF|nr:hypothetical protein [Thalassobaculum salexigens]
MELLGNDSLAAVVHMNMPHGLLSRLVEFGEGFQGCTAIGLRLQGEACIPVGSVRILPHVEGRAPAKFGEHAVEGDRQVRDRLLALQCLKGDTGFEIRLVLLALRQL